MMHLSSSLLTILLTQLLLCRPSLVEGTQQHLRHGGGTPKERVLHPAASHEDIVYPNGTVLVEGGHFLKDPKDQETHPASIIWTGEGNKPNSNFTTTGADPDDASGFDLGATCFSATTTIRVLREGEGSTVDDDTVIIPMKELRVGDNILTSATTTAGEQQQDYGNNQQQYRYERVYSFAHRNPIRTTDFVVIKTASTNSTSSNEQQHHHHQFLELTPAHLVFLEGRQDPIRADSVQVGDVLLGNGGDLHVVIKIGRTRKTGIYAPLTKSGKLVVNGGIVASQYISLSDDHHHDNNESVLLGMFSSHHDYIHVGLAPYRLFCDLWDRFSSTTTTTTAYNNHDGMPPYIEFSIRLSRWVFAQHSVVQFLYLMVFMVVAGVCYGLERLCGESSSSVVVLVLLLAGTATTVAWFRMRISRTRKQ